MTESESTNTSAAPGELEVVRRFVNTYDAELGTDELSGPGSLSGWLRRRRAQRRVRRDAAATSIVSRARARRCAALLFANNGSDAEPEADERPEPSACRLEPRGPLRGRPRGPRAERHRRRSRARADRDDRARGDAGRHLGEAQGVPRRRLRVGVLRPLAQPLEDLVQDGRLRKSLQSAGLSRAPLGLSNRRSRFRRNGIYRRGQVE